MLNKIFIVVCLFVSCECFSQNGLTLELNMNIDSTYSLNLTNNEDSLVCILVSPFYIQDRVNHLILHEDMKFHLTYSQKDQFIEGAITPYKVIYLLPKDSMMVNIIFHENTLDNLLDISFIKVSKSCLKKIKKLETKRNWYSKFIWKSNTVIIRSSL